MPDRLKPSKKEEHLEAEIREAKSTLAADCKRAELATYRARLGRFDLAAESLAVLRQKNEKHPDVELSVWIHLADGILGYFSNVGVSRTDSVQRACALSTAAGLKELRAVCSAWLAQWAYAKLDMEALAFYVREAFHAAEPTNHSARTRASLVVAQALHLAARPDLAQYWYRKSREHAIADRDEITVSALMHNMAWLKMLTMRQVVLTGTGDAGIGRHALMSADSNAHFDQMHGDFSWDELKPLLRAQIVSLQGDAADALSLYEQHLAAGSGALRIQGNLLADKAWCHTRLGQMGEASACARLACASLIAETQTDDRAAAHSWLARVYDALQDVTEAQRHSAIANENWELHVRMQTRTIQLLSCIDENLES